MRRVMEMRRVEACSGRTTRFATIPVVLSLGGPEQEEGRPVTESTGPPPSDTGLDMCGGRWLAIQNLYQLAPPLHINKGDASDP